MNKEKKRHDSKRISIIGKKRTRLLYIFIISLTVLVLAIVYFLIPNIFGDKKSVSPQIRQMRELTAQVGKLETGLKEKENEFSNLLKKYYEQTGEKIPALSALGLSAEQQKVLEDKIKNQGDVSIKELLKDILDKNDEISRIKEIIKKYEALLPRPHIVIEGENHYVIAMNFLINEKKIEERKASRLVERTALFDPLMQGFKVWNFYSKEGDEYGTFVTQGDVSISPNEVSRLAKKKLIDARDSAISEKERLASEIKILEKTRDSINSEVENLRDEKEDLMEQLKNLSAINEKMKGEMQTINSLYYGVKLERDLKKEGILKSVFLGSPKLQEIPPQYFNQAIDLRTKNIIEISAQQLELSQINGITLYPVYYNRDKDYKIEILENKQKAILTILAVEKLKNDRVIICVK
jgi:uncharacterized protein YoxC